MSELQALIRERGLKQRWLAEQLGVHESMLSKWLSGNRPLPREMAERIAEVLAVPVTEFFSCAHDLPIGMKQDPIGRVA